VFLDFYVVDLCTLRFTICGSYIEQVWPPLVYNVRKFDFLANLWEAFAEYKKQHYCGDLVLGWGV